MYRVDQAGNYIPLYLVTFPSRLAWVTPSEVETTNQGETGWASFDTADFGPPAGSSSPSQAKMETDHEKKTQGNIQLGSSKGT